jgi:hypothetical protein
VDISPERESSALPNTIPLGSATRRLNHYTSASRLGSIDARGLAFGEVPLTSRKAVRDVWLTDDTDPAGHGLNAAKREVRIAVEIGATDERLRYWPDWGQQHLDHEWYRVLDRTGDGKSACWWVYFGIIPPGRIVEVVDLRRGAQPVADWRSIPTDPLVERLVLMKQAVTALPGSIPVLDVLKDGSVLARWLGLSEHFALWTDPHMGRLTTLRQAVAALPGPRPELELLDSGDVLARWRGRTPGARRVP